MWSLLVTLCSTLHVQKCLGSAVWHSQHGAEGWCHGKTKQRGRNRANRAVLGWLGKLDRLWTRGVKGFIYIFTHLFWHLESILMQRYVVAGLLQRAARNVQCGWNFFPHIIESLLPKGTLDCGWPIKYAPRDYNLWEVWTEAALSVLAWP